MNKDLKIIQLQEALRQYEEENDQLKAENEHFRVDATRAKQKAKKYLQTLTEIKEIVIKTGRQEPPFDWGKVSDNLKQILHKIYEVEDVESN